MNDLHPHLEKLLDAALYGMSEIVVKYAGESIYLTAQKLHTVEGESDLFRFTPDGVAFRVEDYDCGGAGYYE